MAISSRIAIIRRISWQTLRAYPENLDNIGA
jgi:hypothetical protein